MRLRALDAHFVGEYRPGGHRQLESVDGAQGVLFQCPACAVGKPISEDGEGVQGAHYVLCWFTNPRNAPRVPDDAAPLPGRWTFTGDTVDELTFTGPGAGSVLLEGPGCGWHGIVCNGDAT